jgi:hypothetical protein
MRPTTWRLLVGIALITGAVTWGFLHVWMNGYGALPDVPWPSAVVIAVFGASVLVAALALRPRLRGREGHEPVDPLVAARWGVLSLACSRAGALFAGVYGGFLVTAVEDLTIPFHRHVALAAGACVLASLLLLAAGLVLERVCRLPPPPDEDSEESGPPPSHLSG